MTNPAKVKELVILSGKGGCGKTSIAASFAVLSSNALFADCDVDAADMMLVLQPQKEMDEDFYSGELPTFDPAACKDCGKCIELCRFDAIRKTGEKQYKILEANCEGCGVCTDHCPASALVMKPRLCGEASVSNTPYGKLVHARLGAGGENSGKLVMYVRNKAQELAAKNSEELIIVDGPPGIGCPVIASLGGAWRCLIVTEPTLSGLHDMQRVLKLAKHFDVEAMVCVNKSDINPQLAADIEQHAKQSKAKFLGSIPYDDAVTAAQRQGEAVVCSGGAAAEAIKEIWKQVRQD